MDETIALNRLRAARADIATPREALPEPLMAADIERAIGPVRSWELLLRNRNSRLYRIILPDGQILIAKQSSSRSTETVVTEYEFLQQLAALGIGVSDPRALLLDRRAYVMTAVGGRSIASLVRDGEDARTIEAACRAAGETLARVHHGWLQEWRPLDPSSLMADFEAAPGLTVPDRHALAAACDRIAGMRVSFGQCYLDFDPANVFFAEGHASLIDAPELRVCELQAWDVGTFTAGLRRALWKQPFGRFERANAARRGRAAFEESYRREMGTQGPEREWRTLVSLMEFARVSQLLIWQSRPAARMERALRSLAARFVSVPLLRRERRAVLTGLSKMTDEQCGC